MIKLDSGNVLLKPSHKRQLLAWLKRAQRLGDRLGKFVLTVSLHRTGKNIEATASVSSSAGRFDLKARQHEWKHTIKQLIHSLSSALSMQRLATATI
jgi:hypothetical protein